MLYSTKVSFFFSKVTLDPLQSRLILSSLVPELFTPRGRTSNRRSQSSTDRNRAAEQVSEDTIIPDAEPVRARSSSATGNSRPIGAEVWTPISTR